MTTAQTTTALTSAIEPERGTVEERNLRVVQRMNDAFNRHDFDTAVACHAPEVDNHSQRVPRAVIAAIYRDILTRFPDVSIDVQDCLAQGNSVVVRWIYRGTHRGVGTLPVDGGQLVGVPPTGRSFAVQHLHWWTLEDGLIVAHRACRDDVGMLVQLGLLPEPPAFVLPHAASGEPGRMRAERPDNGG